MIIEKVEEMKQRAAKIKLQGIFLDKLIFERNNEFKKDLSNLSFTFSLNDNSEYIEDSQEIFTTLAIELKKSKENEQLPFTFMISMVGNFKFDNDNIDPHHLELIKSVNCPAIVLPFLRETIATITTKAGYPPLYIPVINFAGKVKNNSKE